MSADVLAHAQEPFYTTKTNGSGLGLTIATQIARDHNGEIRIESREGEGTTVALRLPAAVEGSVDA
jgi:signal transduction histidine kinase